MAEAAGIRKQVIIARNNTGTYGAAPARPGAQRLRRTTSDVKLAKETYGSNEIRDDQQRAVFRHGVRSVPGTINNEMSCGTYADLLAAMVRRDWTAGPSESGLTLTVAGTGPVYTITRASGSWYAAGWKRGMVFRFGAGLAAGSLGKNLQILGIASATSMTVIVVNGSTLAAQSAVSGVSATFVGKRTFMATSNHTDIDFGLEHWYPDLPTSELYLGLKPTRITLQAPGSGNVQFSCTLGGQDVADVPEKRGGVALNTQYFTSPAAATTSNVLTSSSGSLVAQGQRAGVVTSINLELMAEFTGEACVGSDIKPFMTPGTMTAKGQLTAYFNSTSLRDAFWAEQDAEIFGCFTAGRAGDADVFAYTIHRSSLTDVAVDDGNKSLIQTVPFEILLATDGAAGNDVERTTIAFQDSLA